MDHYASFVDFGELIIGKESGTGMDQKIPAISKAIVLGKAGLWVS